MPQDFCEIPCRSSALRSPAPGRVRSMTYLGIVSSLGALLRTTAGIKILILSATSCALGEPGFGRVLCGGSPANPFNAESACLCARSKKLRQRPVRPCQVNCCPEVAAGPGCCGLLNKVAYIGGVRTTRLQNFFARTESALSCCRYPPWLPSSL